MKMPKTYLAKILLGAVLICIAGGISLLLKDALDTKSPTSAVPILTVESNGWIISEVLAMFGPDHIMFASNFPVDSLCGSFPDIFHGFMTVCAMKGYSYAAQRKMFHDNCKRVYRTIAPEDLKGKIVK